MGLYDKDHLNDLLTPVERKKSSAPFPLAKIEYLTAALSSNNTIERTDIEYFLGVPVKKHRTIWKLR